MAGQHGGATLQAELIGHYPSLVGHSTPRATKRHIDCFASLRDEICTSS